MELSDAIKNRRSVRKFLSVPVEWHKICAIIDAGRMAPSAGNMQEWRFIVVTDKDKIAELADAAMGQRFIEQAPIVIVVCADIEKIKRSYGGRGERLYSIQDCAAAIENMFLTITDLGLGTCWIGAFDEGVVRRAVSIPDTARPQAILPIGYPDEKVLMPLRQTLEDVTFFGKYDNRKKDMAAVLGLWGTVLDRKIQKGKRAVKEKAQKVVKKVKQKLKKK